MPSLDRTQYTLAGIGESVVYTLINPETGLPVISMTYTAEQAENLGAELMMVAASCRMHQTDRNADEEH